MMTDEIPPISALFFDDPGPHVVRAGFPTAAGKPNYTPARGQELRALLDTSITQLGGVSGEHSEKNSRAAASAGCNRHTAVPGPGGARPSARNTRGHQSRQDGLLIPRPLQSCSTSSLLPQLSRLESQLAGHHRHRAVCAVLLWWTLRDVSLAIVWQELRQSNGWLFLLSTILSTVIFPLRARRWQTILQPVAPNQPFGALWKATAVGMMANNVLPARAGEIARAYTLTHQTKVPLSTSIASLAVDRLVRHAGAASPRGARVSRSAFPRDAEIAGQSIGSIAQGSVVLVLFLFRGALYCARVFSIADRPRVRAFARRISRTLEDRGKAVLIRFSEGLSVLKSPRRFSAVLTWTIIHWVCNAFGFWFGFMAVGIELPFSAALFPPDTHRSRRRASFRARIFRILREDHCRRTRDLRSGRAAGDELRDRLPHSQLHSDHGRSGSGISRKLGLHLKEIDTARGTTA